MLRPKSITLCGKVNDYYEEPIALVEHDGFCEGGQLLVGDEADARKQKTMEALYSSKTPYMERGYRRCLLQLSFRSGLRIESNFGNQN